ncbi:hypothetical protein CSB07_00570 [Candidatus Gracilibacteria bacterium]|nr:MAG: hypothetical protein CSB07_00570 [Candidatus Gracilibacteria bacterium]PIE85624.1 MAG: hypothetical protein CSA08_01040 [Candidatus Gracilibacteria bacterium]
MNFIKREIKAETIGIIDIGSYKIRAGICNFKNGDLELIGYGEKRQDTRYIKSGEVTNIEGLCKNIESALKKAEKGLKIKVKKIIINISFKEVFIKTNKLNYKRKDIYKEIDKEELDTIIKKVEKKIISEHLSDIKNDSGYNKSDLKLILSNITKIQIDKIDTKKLLGQNGENISLSILNTFIPLSQYNLLEYIEEYLNKKIIKILPSEYAITKLFKKKNNIVIIDVGNYHTSIIIKKEGQIIGVSKIPIGIGNLVKNIRKNNDVSKINIINSMDENIYADEKIDFLEIFEECLIAGLEKILGNNICPHNFFVSGGGSNIFVKNYIKQIKFQKRGIKIIKEVNFVEPKIKYLENILSSSNLNIISMIITTLDFIKKGKDPISESLRKLIKKI